MKYTKLIRFFSVIFIAFLAVSCNKNNDIADETVNNIIGNKEITVVDYYNRINIVEINGSKLITGSKPNITGEYGNGYVLAESYNSFSFQINNMTNKLKKDPKNQLDKRFEQLI